MYSFRKYLATRLKLVYLAYIAFRFIFSLEYCLALKGVCENCTREENIFIYKSRALTLKTYCYRSSSNRKTHSINFDFMFSDKN